jgi:sterol desaturase/sphingolipid hydroxylase (fatty acid hydroxylase superfamily)
MLVVRHVFALLSVEVPAILATLVIVSVIEQFLPTEKEFNGRGVALNCVVGFCFLFVKELTLLGLSVLLVRLPSGMILSFAADQGNIARSFGLVFAWLAIRDFFYYWMHRLQHGSKWLWAEHALHHSDEHVSATTAIRNHWLETPLTVALVNVPMLVLLRPPVITLALVASILSLTEFTNHMNFRFGLGRFSWLVATPQTHRIHHSRLEEHLDKNFAAFLPLWDVIFGTYYAPQRDEYPATGLSSGERIQTVGAALFLPFRMWQKMIEESLRPALVGRRADPGGRRDFVH